VHCSLRLGVALFIVAFSPHFLMSNYHPNYLWGCVTFLVVAGMSLAGASPVAFPGAQGFGSVATGARASTTVYHVTNLNDSGAGSFRNGVQASNQTVVFDVGGYVQILTPISVKSNLTIAGQTAPGQGFGVFGAEVSFDGASNDIVRHIRFRDGTFDPNYPGPTGTQSSTNCINLLSTTNMIFDHCSLEFGAYNNADSTSAVSITIQNCIIADPILFQQFNFHLDTGPATFIGDIFANAADRSVLAKANLQYVNNVCYNYVDGFTTGNSSGDFNYDFINNNFIPGPTTTSPSAAYSQVDSNQSAYATGNLVNGASDNIIDGANSLSSIYFTSSNAPQCPTASLPIVSATSALVNDLANSGTQPRDQVDTQVVSQVASLGTSGSLLSTQADTGLPNSGYGTITGATNPTDTDQDGMPDYWETAMGFNMNSAADGSAQASDGSGYTNLEEYVNWLAGPHAAVQEATNASIQINLALYTTGLTSPTYSVSTIPTGTAILPAGIGAAATTNTGTVTVSGSIATYTPAANTVGLGGFSFTATAANGTITNTVYVCTTATALPVVTVTPAPGTWQGGDANSGNWSYDDNWVIGGSPGTVSGVTSTAVATFNTALSAGTSGFGTWGNSVSNPIVIDQTTQNIGGIGFDTAAANYFIGGTVGGTGPGGNPLLLSSGGTTQILSTLSATNAQETINAPLVLEGSYTLSNISLNGTGAGSGSLNINGSITAASGVTATLTLAGSNTNSSSSDENIITGVISNSPSGSVVTVLKTGGGTWVLSGANTYTGTTTVSGGALQLNTGGVINIPGAAPVTSGQLVINGGSFTAGASSNITAGSIGVSVKGGTATYSGGLTTDAGVDSNWLISVTGGTLSASSMSLGRGQSATEFTSPSTAEVGITTEGLVINGGAVNITGALNMGSQSTGVNSSVNAYLASGSLTVGGTTTITDATNGRYSEIDVYGGTFTSNDTAGAGIKIGGFDKATSDDLFVNGGTVNTNKISFGDSTQTAGTDVMHLNGGALYVGTGGMVKGETSGSTTNLITLSGGTLGALGNWTSSLAMVLGGTSGSAATTIQTGTSSGTAHNISLSGVLSTASGTTAGLKEAGTGTLTLSGANTFTGGVTINSGTVSVATGGTLGSTSDAVTVNTGGTLSLGINQTVGTVTFGGGTISGTGTLTGSSYKSTGGGGTVNVNLAGSGAFTNSSGTTTLSGTDTYSGGTTISGGTVEFSKTTSMPATGTVAVSSGATLAVIVGSGTGQFTNAASGNGSIGALLAGIGGQGATVTWSSGSALGLDTTSATGGFTYAGNITTAGLGLTQIGTGTLTLAGTNTYTGATTVKGGTLKFNNTGALSSGSAVTVNSGGSLTVMVGSTAGLFTNATSGAGSLGGLLSTVTFSSGSVLGIDTTNATGVLTYAGNITTAGLGLTKLGTGTLTLSGTNSYTGPTTVSAGVLNSNHNLTSSSSLTIASGATLNLAGNLTTSGTITNNGTLVLGVGVNVSSTGTFTNNGTLDLTNDAGYTLPGNFVNNGTVLAASVPTDTPTMPPWALALLAALLFFAAAPLLVEKNRYRRRS
jgi:autotransporter-associated beta strand protein